MNAAEIAYAIRTADLSREDLNFIIDALNAKSRSLREVAKRAFRPTQRVQFVTRDGFTVKGVVVRLMQKNVKVLSDTGVMWTVSPTILTEERK